MPYTARAIWSNLSGWNGGLLPPRYGRRGRSLGWSQSELGFRVGLTQRAIHKLEQGETEPRRATVRALEEVFREELLSFEDVGDGGFRVHVHASVLDRPVAVRPRRDRNARVQLGITAPRRPPTYRA